MHYHYHYQYRCRYWYRYRYVIVIVIMSGLPSNKMKYIWHIFSLPSCLIWSNEKVLTISSVSLRIPKINVLYYRNRVAAGGSWLVRSTPQKAFRVRVLAGYAVFCS